MSIFVASTKSISRAKGQSAVASASYRAGVELEDRRYGKTHDYSKRHGVMSADIILPSSLQNKNITIGRAELWNLAEETETRKNSRVAREWLVNLPYELDEQTRKELAHEFAQALADRFGTIADCAIHRPTEKEIERGADARNFHAHIMLTTRKAELDQDGKITLTNKADCEVSDSQRKKMGLSKAKDEVTEIRQLWETLANKKLLEHGHQLIDSRSYESQGIDILPQIKMGSVATKLERDGKQTMRGEINRAITERNELVFNRELADNKRINDRADQIIFESRKNNEREQRNDRFREAITTASGFVERTKRGIDGAIKLTEATNLGIGDSTKRIKKSEQRIEKSKLWITASTKRARISKQIVARRIAAATTPNPYDDQCTTSANRRKQAVIETNRQQRQNAETARQYDKYSFNTGGGYANTKRIVSEAKYQLAHRIIYHNHRDFRLEGFNSRIDDDRKFNERQRRFISDATASMEIKPLIDTDYRDFRGYVDSVGSQIDLEFIENNTKLIEMLIDPVAERERYALTASQFDNFITELDERRESKNIELRSGMGGRNEVSRMVSETMTAPSYIDAIDDYIKDSTTPDDCKTLALEHRRETVNITVVQFDLAIRDLHTVPSNYQKSTVDALNASLHRFTNKPSIELSSEQIGRIQSRLKSNNEPTVTRSYSSPSFNR